MEGLFQSEDAELERALALAVSEAKDEVRSYTSKLYSRIRRDIEFSERASFRARLSSRIPLHRNGTAADPADPFHPDRLAKYKEADQARLWRLVDAFAEIREP
jgi:hypothetical protein